jgi:SpoVK/Ycf46/Vps4 family AAA+-type ATPase
MNIKKSILTVLAFLLITNAQVVYTKDQQDDNNKSQLSINSDDNDTLQNSTQYNEEMWKFIEETLQSVTDQTQKIEFCLQTIEQIINAGKIKFDDKEIKSEVLHNIKNIKHIIQNIFTYYTTQLTDKGQSMSVGTCYNTAFIEYLLPVFQNDIKTISVENFTTALENNIERILNNLESNDEQLFVMIETNEANLKLLMTAGDNVGLSMFNKFYRYLESQPLPVTGQPTLTTLGNVAYWGGMGLLVYGVGAFAVPKDFKIPYLDCNLPFKLGSNDRVDTYKKAPNQDEKDRAAAQFQPLDYVELGLREAKESYLVMGTIGIVSLAIMNKWKEIKKSSEQSWNKTINYLRGDIVPAKKSNDIPKAYFIDMVNGEDLEKIARQLTDYLKNPIRYDRMGNGPSTGYLLVGPSQTGKTFFARALKTMIDEEFENSNQEVKFLNITADDLKYFGSFSYIFELARKNAPVIIFMDEIDMFGARRHTDRTNTQELLMAINGMETDPSKKVIVIAATNKPEELDFALKQKGRLGTVITFDFPTYECRKAYLEKQLNKKNIILSSEMIEAIAQETKEQTYNMIDDIIRQALQLATFQTRPVTEADFEMTLDREIRKIKPNSSVSISVKEKELVAIYQAGQAVARHVLVTDEQIVKITINLVDKPIKSKEGFGVINEQKGEQHENHELLPETRMKPTRLGCVFTMSKTNNHELISDDDQQKELMALLAGQAALELIKGKTFNGFGKEDRAKVIEALEKKISQGTPITDAIRQQALAAKEILYNQVKAALKNHVDFIVIVRDELIKNHTINTKQWLQLAANYRI